MPRVPKKKFAGEWKKLAVLPRFQTLASFPYLLRSIHGGLHGMGAGAYCEVRRERDWTREDSPEVERVMMIFWAANDEWAEAVVELRRYGQVSNTTVDFDAPMELLPKGAHDWTNAETYRAARSDRKNPIPESACYGSGVGFKYRTVHCPGLEILYASRRVKKRELPFAIQLILRRSSQ